MLSEIPPKLRPLWRDFVIYVVASLVVGSGVIAVIYWIT
jgi:hypothetical protein